MGDLPDFHWKKAPWAVWHDGFRVCDVWPMNDWREHTLGRECWCKPTPATDDDSILVHNSMDRREDYEQGRKHH